MIIGVTRFELAISRPPDERFTRLSHTPKRITKILSYFKGNARETAGVDKKIFKIYNRMSCKKCVDKRK